MMGWDHGAWGAGDWLLMSLMMVVFWGGLVALVVWLVRSSRDDRPQRPDTAPSPVQHADEVLAERFARGEIDEEEFTRRRELLRR